jgi:predicted PurR-regulated permease PerM
MQVATQPEPVISDRPPPTLWDTLIRVGLIGGLALLCFRIFSPFLNLTVSSIILSIAMFPLHQWIARRIGGRQKLASAIVLLVGFSLLVIPTWTLMNSFADSVGSFVSAVQENTLRIPPPSDSVKTWPLIGNDVHNYWSRASSDLPGLIQSMQPKMSDLARDAFSIVASIARSMLLLLVAFLIATIVMAYGESAGSSGRMLFTRLAGPTRGEKLAQLALSTIRAVALGVVGVAAIQALLIGLALMLARIPIAGVLAIIALVLGIAQVPAIIITLPVIIYIWASGDYSSGAAIGHTIVLLVTSLADNILKPLMLGRGVAVPMPVILFGALGGMATGGIQGMFVGATALALGYELVKDWIATSREPSKI